MRPVAHRTGWITGETGSYHSDVLARGAFIQALPSRDDGARIAHDAVVDGGHTYLAFGFARSASSWDCRVLEVVKVWASSDASVPKEIHFDSAYILACCACVVVGHASQTGR